jgi:hypothetical protein
VLIQRNTQRERSAEQQLIEANHTFEASAGQRRHTMDKGRNDTVQEFGDTGTDTLTFLSLRVA